MTRIDDQSANTAATVARFSAALERRDVDGLLAEMTDDVVLESPGPAPEGERYEGAAAVGEFFARFFEANPNAKFDEEEVCGRRSVRRALAIRLGRGPCSRHRCDATPWWPHRRDAWLREGVGSIARSFAPRACTHIDRRWHGFVTDGVPL